MPDQKKTIHDRSKSTSVSGRRGSLPQVLVFVTNCDNDLANVRKVGDFRISLVKQFAGRLGGLATMF